MRSARSQYQAFISSPASAPASSRRASTPTGQEAPSPAAEIPKSFEVKLKGAIHRVGSFA